MIVLLACLDSVGFLEDTNAFYPYGILPTVYRDREQNEAYMYSVDPDGRGIKVYDVSDPSNPKWVGITEVPDSFYLYSLTTIDSFLYVYSATSEWRNLLVFALRPDPANPRLINVAPLSREGKPYPYTQRPWGYSPETKTLYLCSGRALKVFDLSDPCFPQYLGSYVLAPGGQGWGSEACRVYYPYAYLAYFDELDSTSEVYRFEVHDISDSVPELITRVEKTRTWGSIGDIELLIAPDGRKLIVAPAGYGNPNVFDVTDPERVKAHTLSEFAFTSGLLAHNEDFSKIYGLHDGIFVAAVSDSPYILCRYADSTKYFKFITFSGGYLYLIGSWQGGNFLYVMRYDGEGIEERASGLRRLYVSGNTLFVQSVKRRRETLELYSPDGRLVFKRALSLREGLNRVELPRLKRGLYLGRLGEHRFKLVGG